MFKLTWPIILLCICPDTVANGNCTGGHLLKLTPAPYIEQYICLNEN